MTAKRISTRELTRLLDGAPRPLYVLDEELTVVFLNEACRNWLGPAAEGSPGEQCTYQTPAEAEGPAAVAAGLCPPPQVLEGRAVEAVVACPRSEGKAKRRRARFIPLNIEPDAAWLIIALLDADDLPPQDKEDSGGLDSSLGPIGPLASIPESASLEEPGPLELHEAIRQFRAEAAGRYRADRLTGVSPAARLARRQVEMAAAGRCSVLVVGPPGSGRSDLAAAIHYGDRVKKEDERVGLITLDCSVLPADVVISTMTSATRVRAGDQAKRPATLLLSHADEIPAELQIALSALLVQRAFPLRVMATAVSPLTELAARGQFREDLAAALSTLTIVLPPLVQRREDIPYLAQLFLEDCNSQGTKQVAAFTPEALDRLDAYPWPGNAAELAEAVAEAHRKAAGREIAAADLPERLHVARQAAAHPRRPEEKIVLDEFLGHVERELIRRALARTKGNKAKAARLLGLTRSRLYRRMVEWGLE